MEKLRYYDVVSSMELNVELFSSFFFGKLEVFQARANSQ